jgi:predicted O-methyltransferase YrrM
MDNRIMMILDELEQRSILEKTRKVVVSPEDRMLAITKETGELLNMILYIKKAKNMLEIGTSTGYSTIWCAEAIKKNSGKVITIERNLKKINKAKKNFMQAGLSKIIKIQQGDAIDILSQLNKMKKFQNHFDFVLIDADKENIISYFDLILPMVAIDGIIVTDNMFYPEKYRSEMSQFSQYLKNNSKIKTITTPIGNGEEITIKISD